MTAPRWALTGSELGWLLSELAGVVPGVGRLISPTEAAVAERTWRLADGTPRPQPWVLYVDASTATAAAQAGSLDVTDPEGAPLATVAVHESGSDEGRFWLAGPLTATSPPTYAGYPDLRSRATEPWPGTVVWVTKPLGPAARAEVPAAATLVGALDPAVSDRLREHALPRVIRVLRASGVGAQAALLPLPSAASPGRTGAAGAAALGTALVVAATRGAAALLLPADSLTALPAEGAARVLGLAAELGMSVAELPRDSQEGGAPNEVDDQQQREIDAVRGGTDRRGAVLMLSGFSGSGKSTIARALLAHLLERGSRAVTLLDGDIVRLHLSKGLGFSAEDRETNILRIGFVAAQIARAGGVVICAPIAPSARVRDEVRAMVEAEGALFELVHVSTSIEECERRDRKGLYARARAGLIPDFTGISAPYDVPTNAELVIDAAVVPVDESVQRILADLEGRGIRL